MRSKSKEYQTKSGNVRTKLKNSIDDYPDVNGDVADDDDDEVVDVELNESDDNSNKRHERNISGYNHRNNAVNADDIDKKRDDYDDDDINSIVQTSLRLFRKLCLYCYRKYFQSVLLLSVGAAIGIIITIFYFDYNHTDTSQSHRLTINTAVSPSSTSSSSSNDLLSSLSLLPTNILSLTSNISIFDLSVTTGSKTASISGGIQQVEKKSMVVNPIVKLSPTWVSSLKKNSNRTSSVIEAILAKSNNYEQFTRYLELYKGC